MDRRTFLRGLTAGGASVAVAIPILDCMLNGNGEAFAAGGPLPLRFGTWFWGCGMLRDQWVPPTTAANWTSAELAPLVDPALGLRPYVSVATGCRLRAGTSHHHSGMAGILTGADYRNLGPVRDTTIGTVQRPTIDVVIRNFFKGKAPIPSLELGIWKPERSDEGPLSQYISFNGPDDFNPAEFSPAGLYRRLVGLTQRDGAAVKHNLGRTSVLDSVSDQIETLKSRVGAADRARLERHFESVRGVEVEIGTTATCSVKGVQDPALVNGQFDTAKQTDLMSQLLAQSLACGLTNVFSFLFSSHTTRNRYWQVNEYRSHHGITHDLAGWETIGKPIFHQATVHTMQMFAKTLAALKNTPEGAGNLLDRCAILGTSDLSDAYRHGLSEYPIIVAGKAGGALKGGVHYRSANAENTSNVLFTLIKAMGLPNTSFGYGAGESSTTVPI